MGTIEQPKISHLGHAGLRCFDVERMCTFFVDTLGLSVTDRNEERGWYFLSPNPAEEHHMLLLMPGRQEGKDDSVLQQLSWRCETLDDVLGLYKRLVDAEVKFELVVCHGNAVGVYFRDPEDNLTEVYWPTGLEARQPFGVPIDLNQSRDNVMAHVEASVRKYGKTGTAHLGQLLSS